MKKIHRSPKGLDREDTQGRKSGYIAEGQGIRFTFRPEGVLFTPNSLQEGMSPLLLRLLNTSDKMILRADQELKNGWIQDQDHPSRYRYQKVIYQDIWPGIDLIFSGNQQQLKYDLFVYPGASIKDIRFIYDGGEGLTCSEHGDLIVQTGCGILYEKKPVSFQWNQQDRLELPTSFHLYPDQTIGFEIEEGYNPEKLLVIDPIVFFSTFLGGSSRDIGTGIAVDSSGNSYVTGLSRSTNFPVTSGAFQTINIGESVFVTKFNPSGSSLIYSTLIVGDAIDQGNAIALDADQNAYITGLTTSNNFPITSGAFQSMLRGETNAFVTKLNADGSSLLYSTYLGGSGGEETAGDGIVTDLNRNAYVTGFTCSSDFPVTTGAFQTVYGGGLSDGFVTKLNATGTALVYSTYLGGLQEDTACGIALDENNQAYVTGTTFSTNFPTTPGAFQTILPTNPQILISDAFITKLNTTGTSLVYSTFLGGNSDDFGNGISLDGGNNAYVTGLTRSSDFPITESAFQTIIGEQNFSAFVTSLNAEGSSLNYSTFLGDVSEGFGIAVDEFGAAWVTGCTSSDNFPITSDAFQDRLGNPVFGGITDAFITQISYSGRGLVFSSYLGGNSADEGRAVALDLEQNAYFTGCTFSVNFPVSFNAFQRNFGPTGIISEQAFVFKLGSLTVPGPTGPTGARGPRGPRGPRGKSGGEFNS
ncbi:SBBP repeat-containing protein [Mechercharimyces sp. CAU 1602]|uniref:SBBP repeat-containing protein n=1 Tax=Mechercharimyces sp. CAU 1602 TaxID=2973933 RepID=UPI0021614411|nr:SBBP repeat-containing protein [Mechercharimyces sp. CAU 1602]MCS1350584.1 SBBP repeat-containing protein [Mechercharimyces sp. CAU 1602]